VSGAVAVAVAVAVDEHRYEGIGIDTEVVEKPVDTASDGQTIDGLELEIESAQEKMVD
jgi:4'-phosphopantetheinyl transferase EntD